MKLSVVLCLGYLACVFPLPLLAEIIPDDDSQSSFGEVVGATLLPGGTLQVGQTLRSPNKQFFAPFQTDLNFVVYDGPAGEALWWTGVRPGGYRVTLDDHCNVRIVNEKNEPLWESGTNQTFACQLKLENDGKLVLYSIPQNFPVATAEGTGRFLAFGELLCEKAPIPNSADYCGGEISATLGITLGEKFLDGIKKEWGNDFYNNAGFWLACKNPVGALTHSDIVMTSNACGTTGGCAQCVRVGGVKQWSWDVNYALWGFMRRICQYGIDTTLAKAKLYKAVFKSGEYSEYVGYWTKAGWYFADALMAHDALGDPLRANPWTFFSAYVKKNPLAEKPEYLGCGACPRCDLKTQSFAVLNWLLPNREINETSFSSPVPMTTPLIPGSAPGALAPLFTAPPPTTLPQTFFPIKSPGADYIGIE